MNIERLVTIDDCFRELEVVEACKGVLQGPFHEYDVYDHQDRSFQVILDMTPDPHLTVAARLHDIGKLETQEPLMKEDGIIWYREDDPELPYYRFPGHEFYGKELVLGLDPNIFAQFALNQFSVANLVAHHYLPMKHIKAMREQVSFEGFKWEFYSLIDALERAPVTKDEIMTLFYADMVAHGDKCTDQVELFAIRALIIGEPGLGKEAIYREQQEKYHSQRD
jgi:hypothetical protein